MNNPAHSELHPEGAAFIDGCIVPIAQARLPLLDWGFLHSDATYDVVHVWQGAFFRLNDHLDRFERGMQKLHMDLHIDRGEIRGILLACVRATGLQNAYVEMICTRGVPKPGSRDPRDCTNTFYAFAIPYVSVANSQQERNGLRIHISQVQRISPESVDPTVKNYHWLDMVKGLYEAYDHGQETAVLTNSKGNVIEGPGFNVFARVNGVWITPAQGALEGITRRTAIEAANELNLAMREQMLPAQALREASEAFITSTAGGIIPIAAVDGISLPDGSPGPQTQQIKDLYWQMHTRPQHRLYVYDTQAD